jgi:hypothetical protein
VFESRDDHTGSETIAKEANSEVFVASPASGMPNGRAAAQRNQSAEASIVEKNVGRAACRRLQQR